MGSSLEFAAFCRVEHPRLVGALSLMCRDPDLAEELAQEALARAWRHWRKVARLDNPAAWVHRVAINLANSHFRRAAAQRRLNHKIAQPRVHMDADMDLAESFRAALAQLPPPNRAAVILRFYLEFTYFEIAQTLDVPEGTAKSLVHRGLEKLRQTENLHDIEEAWNAT